MDDPQQIIHEDVPMAVDGENGGEIKKAVRMAEEPQQIEEQQIVEEPYGGASSLAAAVLDDEDGWAEYGDEDWGAEYGQEDDMENVDLPPMIKQKTKSYFGKQQFKIVHIDEVEQMMPILIDKVKELLDFDDDKAIAVLRHFQWDYQKVEDQWFLLDDSKFTDIGLDFDTKLVEKHPEINSTLKENNGNMCMVMYSEFEPGDPDYDSDQLCCGHQFSKISWRMYLKEKIKENGPQSVFTKCAQLRCNVVVPHSFFLKYLEDKVDDDGINYYSKYKNWHVKQFADMNKKLKWCPEMGCDHIAHLSDFCMVNTVSCACGNDFCLKCEQEDHAPCNCQQVALWKFKEQDQAENLTWIKANTKPCPKCSTFIEKNQGCNHMTCQKCGHHFCWLCLGDWSKHGGATGGYYACNIFEKMSKEDKELAGKMKEVQDAKNELARYVYSFERYQNHSKSRDIAKKQRKDIMKKVEKLHDVKKYPTEELAFFDECAKEVIACRQVLKWTYVIDYFHSKDLLEHERELFKYQQGALEEFCEKTHQLLESDLNRFLDVSVIDRSPFYQFKGEVVNSMAALRHSFKTLITDTMKNPKFQPDEDKDKEAAEKKSS